MMDLFIVALANLLVQLGSAKRIDRAVVLDTLSSVDALNETGPVYSRLSVGLEEPELRPPASAHDADQWGANNPPFDNMYCPRTGAATHASAKVVTLARGANCNDVRTEIVWRSDNFKGWHDPGNLYSNAVSTYKPLSSRQGSLKIDIGRTTPRFKFHDLINFELTQQSGDCLIRGCSKSQGFSVIDYHTNYCNIFNLICGSEHGCHGVKHDFVTEEVSAFSSCGQRDYQRCLKYIDAKADVSKDLTDPEHTPSLKGMILKYTTWARELWENYATKPAEWLESFFALMPWAEKPQTE